MLQKRRKMKILLDRGQLDKEVDLDRTTPLIWWKERKGILESGGCVFCWLRSCFASLACEHAHDQHPLVGCLVIDFFSP